MKRWTKKKNRETVSALKIELIKSRKWKIVAQLKQIPCISVCLQNMQMSYRVALCCVKMCFLQSTAQLINEPATPVLIHVCGPWRRVTVTEAGTSAGKKLATKADVLSLTSMYNSTVVTLIWLGFKNNHINSNYCHHHRKSIIQPITQNALNWNKCSTSKPEILNLF